MKKAVTKNDLFRKSRLCEADFTVKGHFRAIYDSEVKGSLSVHPLTGP